MTKKAKQVYTDWHWGIEPDQKIKWNDPDLPDYLVECGRLVEIHYQPFDEEGQIANPEEEDVIIELTGKDKDKSHLAFDPEHKNQRLYFLLSPSVKKQLRKKVKLQNPDHFIPLKEVASWTGGKHATKDYPNISVCPLGVMTNVVYGTHKKGDGPSSYIHEMGEETGIKPILAMDKKGRMWFAGGDYTSPTAGITN